MGRIYVCTIDAADAESTTASQIDFFEIAPADDHPVIVHACFIGQLTEEADAQAEMLGVEIRRGGTAMTSGSGGNAAADPVDPWGGAGGDANFQFESMNTTLATFTSGVIVHSDAFNVQVGWQYVPLPEHRILCHQGHGGFVVRVQGAPADSTGWTGTLIVEEL